MNDGVETYIDTKPLEIHVDRIVFKRRIFWFACQFIFFSILTIALAISDEYWVVKYGFITVFLWLLFLTASVIYEGYVGLFTKGPVFSFSKHALIDHRAKIPKIYKWQEVEFVAWLARQDDQGKYHILQIDIHDKPKSQTFGWIIGYHPYWLNSRMITSPKHRLATRIKEAVPPGKYKTAKDLK